MSAAGRLSGPGALLALVAALALPGAAHASPEQPLRLTVVFTGDTGGYLEPCG